MVLIGMTLLSAPLTPLPRIGRCASPVAMEPQLDMGAAFACAFSFSPVVLGLHWGTEWNEARDRCSSAQKRFEMERLRLMCGEGACTAHHIERRRIDRIGRLTPEDAAAHTAPPYRAGCLVDYQEAEEELMLAKQARQHLSIRHLMHPSATHTPCIIRHACTMHARRTCTLLQAANDFRNFRVAGATRQVVSQLPLLGRAAASRTPQAAMAMGGQGQIVSKPKATPEEAEAEAEVGSEATAAASPGRGGGDPVMQQSMAVEAEVGLPTGLPWPMPARLFTREEALDTLFDVGSSQPVERGVY